jgi:hypothetical protein
MITLAELVKELPNGEILPSGFVDLVKKNTYGGKKNDNSRF